MQPRLIQVLRWGETTENQKEKLLGFVFLLGEASTRNVFHLEISLANQAVQIFHFNFSFALYFSLPVSLFLYYSPLLLLLPCSYFAIETEMSRTRKENEK